MSATTAALWRREPYAIFFPLGILISWAGVGRWLVFALGGRAEDYVPVYIFHGMAQIQGFLLCFAMGFLFTMIPRRTGTEPPTAVEMSIGILAPLATVAASWMQKWALSQMGWMAACILIAQFVVRRFLSKGAMRRPPAGFVWIPIAFLLGLGGSILTGIGGALGGEWMRFHNLGQQFVLQGVFVCLVLGVGGLALPLMTRGEAPPDAPQGTRGAMLVAAHVGAASLLVFSFFLQQDISLSLGCGLRAAVVAAVLFLDSQLWKTPSLPGWNRRVVWLSAWMLPLGFTFAALFPAWYQAGLHLSFLGGFAMLALAVSTHVILGHGDRADLIAGRPWQVGSIAMLMTAALVSRMAMTMQPLHRDAWMATAAVFFLGATLVWGAFLVPVLRTKLR